LRNLASALFLTEGADELVDNKPKVAGRIVTTLPKAKEVRPLVERCITLARSVVAAEESAQEHASDAERNTDAWKTWRGSDRWRKWSAARAPAVAGRRRLLVMLGDKRAVRVLCETVAPRFVDRPGGYTRILRLAKPRLGDAGARAILEFTGVRDRAVSRSKAPAFDEDA
jgi:large subunit ribosomal protein L17